MSAPTLETERLILRPHLAQDLAECHALWSHPEVYRYTSGKPSTEQDAWRRILMYTGHWKILGYGYWAILEKATGLYLGQGGFADFRRELTPSIHGIPEAGWVFAPHAHGKGYAHEFMRAAYDWATHAKLGPHTVCIIDPKNLASLKLAAKLGFTPRLETTYLGEPVVLFDRHAT